MNRLQHRRKGATGGFKAIPLVWLGEKNMPFNENIDTNVRNLAPKATGKMIHSGFVKYP